MIPMLDVQGWTEEIVSAKRRGTIICHTYYEKAVTSPLDFHNRGVYSVKQKILILAEECRRRFYNQDRRNNIPERMKDITKFIQKLVDLD